MTVQARNRALLQCGAYQRSCQRLDHRHRRPAQVLLQPEGVTLQHNSFLLDDKQACDVGTVHIRINAVQPLPGLIARRNLLATLQLQNRQLGGIGRVANMRSTFRYAWACAVGDRSKKSSPAGTYCFGYATASVIRRFFTPSPRY